MTEQNKKTETRNIPDNKTIFNEIIYRRYIVNRDKVRDTLDMLTVPEYIVLHGLQEKMQDDRIYGGRIYLKEVAEIMEISTRAASRLARNLKEKGLVTWQHEGTGEDGTYIELTKEGEALLDKQENVLAHFFERVLDTFGKENAVELLRLMKQMESVMACEYEKMKNEKHRAEGEEEVHE